MDRMRIAEQIVPLCGGWKRALARVWSFRAVKALTIKVTQS